MTTSDKQAFGSKGTAFQRLHQLLDGLEPGRDAINLTVGEPQHPVPDFVATVLQKNAHLFNKYPPITGIPAYRETVSKWLETRYQCTGLIDTDRGILPLNGTREGLFFGAIEAQRRLKKPNPAILLPNPFYAAYAAGIIAAGCEPVLVDSPAETGFLPNLTSLDDSTLDHAIGFYFASPTNPQGSVAGLDLWSELIKQARAHDFYIFADECYSEIYRKTPPPGVLEAAKLTGSVDNIITFHSLSKRSNLAGLRSGFAAGDPDFLSQWVKFRNMAAPQVPVPVQHVAIAALEDEAHVIENRRLYNEKYAVANRLLAGRYAYQEPQAGFFLWLDVSAFGGGVSVARDLWTQQGVKAVPGTFLSEDRPDGSNPGDAYIRLALVQSVEQTEDALQRLITVLER